MMSYYRLSESQPGLLETRGQIEFDQDFNAEQEVFPNRFPVAGHEYSIQELIDMMIVDSDNNSFVLLSSKPEVEELLQGLFADLRLFYPYNQDQVKEVMTVQEFSHFFRLLRSSTYLQPELSENALQTLSRSTYKNGIVAGVPENTTVAHKYGLGVTRDPVSHTPIHHQLHDCGIVYPNQKRPYIICLMSKSSTLALADIEQVLSNISKAIYENHLQ